MQSSSNAAATVVHEGALVIVCRGVVESKNRAVSCDGEAGSGNLAMRILRTCGFVPSWYTRLVFSDRFRVFYFARYPTMEFIIRAKAAESSPIHLDGTWTVEADSREGVVTLMEQQIGLLPVGATWTIHPWTADDYKTSDNRSAPALQQLVKPVAAA